VILGGFWNVERLLLRLAVGFAVSVMVLVRAVVAVVLARGMVAVGGLLVVMLRAVVAPLWLVVVAVAGTVSLERVPSVDGRGLVRL
jgi:hypothetical protein